ncbi:MAG: very short patch repair endonuclease [Rhodospirillales bacterium]
MDRSENMSRVRSKNTSPEMTVRRALHRAGFRFRLHRKDLPGRPDIVLPKKRLCIFVNGCFWHQHPRCPKSKRPKTNAEFWNAKLDANIIRDKKNHAALRQLGWKVLVLWECEINRGDEFLHKIN